MPTQSTFVFRALVALMSYNFVISRVMLARRRMPSGRPKIGLVVCLDHVLCPTSTVPKWPIGAHEMGSPSVLYSKQMVEVYRKSDNICPSQLSRRQHPVEGNPLLFAKETNGTLIFIQSWVLAHVVNLWQKSWQASTVSYSILKALCGKASCSSKFL